MKILFCLDEDMFEEFFFGESPIENYSCFGNKEQYCMDDGDVVCKVCEYFTKSRDKKKEEELNG